MKGLLPSWGSSKPNSNGKPVEKNGSAPRKPAGSAPAEKGQASGSGNTGGAAAQAPPLLLHFDVNKTIIQSDTIQMKSIEDGVREGISELFWGTTRREKDQLVWEWTRHKPACLPPPTMLNGTPIEPGSVINYGQYCKEVVKDKADRKEVIKSFRLVTDHTTREEMEKQLQTTMKKMQLSPEVRQTLQDEGADYGGPTIKMFPALFRLVAALARSKRMFAVLFRSFGTDHEKILKEWNAFCEMKHPVFSNLLNGIGPLDGSQPGTPDRRILGLHTLYRDQQGPVLILNTFTNGPQDASWDSWAKQKPKAQTDTRNGRDYIHNVHKAQTVEGVNNIQQWMKQHLMEQGTAAIKDDWAWWQWHGEQAHAGKLLTLIPSKEGETKQLFFDDNIDHSDARIVDCRDEHGAVVKLEDGLNKIYTKVNPVEAVLDDDYFIRKLHECHGQNHMDVSERGLMEWHKQLTEVEEERNELRRQIKNLNRQLQQVSEENRHIKFQRRVAVKDESHLKELLGKDKNLNLDKFGEEGRRTISQLYMDIVLGSCWLEHDENDRIVRVIEMVFLKILYKDMVLIEVREQDQYGRTQTRNYLPGTNKGMKDSFEKVLERWLQAGLELDLSKVVTLSQSTIFNPEAPNQQTSLTKAYPMPCRVQHNMATYIIQPKEVESFGDILGKIGLPSGSHFSTNDVVMGTKVTRFWRWDKQAAFEAAMSQLASAQSQGTAVNITHECEKLFKEHPRREAYENLILQMFEMFQAQKLAGGFSGSLVVRVQPFNTQGQPTDPCIVKFDEGAAIREEFKNSVEVFKALPDRAARILGDAAYAEVRGKEFGAMKLELAGACWNIPELSQGSGGQLCTFKDLLLYEGEQVILGSTGNMPGEVRPFGNTNTVLAETFGVGGVVGSLRKNNNGPRRSDDTSLLWGWYTLKGKPSKYNPYTAEKGQYPPEASMRELYKKYFGSEMPDLTAVVIGQIKPALQNLAKTAGKEMRPLIGLAHGDLNAANIMIDALDAVWLIDFATSVELPLFTDMCKFEMACLFEYAAIPITPKVLISFVGPDENMYRELNVGDWLRVDNDVAIHLIKALTNMAPEKLDNLTESDLHTEIKNATDKSSRGPQKRRAMVVALKARLTVNEKRQDATFLYAKTISETILRGDYIGESLEITSIPLPTGMPAEAAQGALGLRFFMDIVVAIRRFMHTDVMTQLRELERNRAELMPADASSLQMWLPFLRESFRIVGYSDISPTHKLWSIYHCDRVSREVLGIIDTLTKNIKALKNMPLMASLRRDLAGPAFARPVTTETLKFNVSHPNNFSETSSHWLYAHGEFFTNKASKGHAESMTRKVHAACPLNKSKPGAYCPVYQVLGSDQQPLPLSFDPTFKEQLEVFLSVESIPDLGKECVGYMVSNGNANAAPKVVLKSRLLNVRLDIMQHKFSDFIHFLEQAATIPDFSLPEWADVGSNGTEQKSRNSHAVSKGKAGNSNGQDDQVPIMLKLDAIVRDSAGKERQRLKLVLGSVTCCYPIGSNLCIDTNQVQCRHPVIVLALQPSGLYRICDAPTGVQTPTPNERDFDPLPSNHVFVTPCAFEDKDPIYFWNEDRAAWHNAIILEEASAKTGWRWRLQLKNKEYDPQKDGSNVREGPGEESVLRYLHIGMCGPSVFKAPMFDEDTQRLKGYFRSRHSYIIDALSGAKIELQACALPILHVDRATDGRLKNSTSDGSGNPRSSSQGGAASNRVARAASMGMTLRTGTNMSGSTSIYQNNIGVDNLGGTDARHGWTLMQTAIENYEQGMPTCVPSAFLIVGSPGSGKTCLLCRLVMDCLERQHALIPMLFTCADLVKRSIGVGQDLNPETMNNEQVHAWFDRYLRITYGEDSQRYRAICQAIRGHRVMFLFEGLEDCGYLTPVIERLISHIVLNRHLVVVTSRPLVGGPNGASRLQEMGVYVTTLRLQPVTDEQKRAIASARLGVGEGLAMFDRFMQRLRERQGSEGSDQAGEDVFGNPMMLSMLLCYLQLRLTDAKNHENEEVTLTAAYKMAVKVMLLRVQSRAQAERLERDTKVEQSKRILEIMAAHMQVKQVLAIEEKIIPDLLPPELRETYKPLKAAVEAGHAILLRASTNESNKGTEEKKEFRFLVKGFQDYFAACDLNSQENPQLPVEVIDLLQDPWWIQMLDMLAEEWPKTYVDLIQRRLPKFRAVDGDNFLHIAARVGHRPVFQLLKLFKDEYQNCIIQRNKKLETPLHLAAEKGHTSICLLMLQHKAEIEAEDNQDKLPLHSAMCSGNFQTAKVLLENWNEWSKSEGKTYAQKPQAEQLASRIYGSLTSSGLSESEFLQAAQDAFVELRYYTQGELVDKKKALGALVSVYCIVTNKYQEFTRAQPKDERLTEKSWETLQKWTTDFVGLTKDNATATGAMLVFVSMSALGKISSLREVFAPDFDDPNEALAHILLHHPIILPSYWKLGENMKSMIKTAVKAEFNVGQYIQAENLPANLFTVKEILGSGENAEAILGFILFRIFATICGVTGAVTLDGSLFMKESNYAIFRDGLESLQRLVDLSAPQVYNNFLAKRAKGQGLDFRPEDDVSRAVVRLACNCRVFNAEGGKNVQDCFYQLEESERLALVEKVNKDGVSEKPAYLLYNSPLMLENANKNKVIGRFRAMRMLLQLYQLAEQEYGSSKKRVVTVMCEEMAQFTQKCLDPEIFEFAKFYIARKAGPKADSVGTVHLYPWQLVTDLNVLEGYNEKSDSLIREFTGGNMREPAFVKKLSSVFPELSYFMQEDQALLEQTKAAFLMVYWTVTNQREAIIRAQEKEQQLTDRSWQLIYRQDGDEVNFFMDVDILNRVMVVIALHNLGKVKRLQKSLAPGVTNDKQCLAYIMQNSPKVFPSYYRLQPQDKWLVRQIVTQEFSFEQFLCGENLPANLTSVKAMLTPKNEGADMKTQHILEFYLFSVYVMLGGSMGDQSLEGSLFMTEANFRLFHSGKEALSKLIRRSEVEVYNAYLESRAKDMGLPHDTNSQRAVARLALMCSATDTMQGLLVSEKFKDLEREQDTLAKYLLADGINDRAFMLQEAPQFLKNAWNNSEVGLTKGLRILVRVYQDMDELHRSNRTKGVTIVNLQRLHKVAKDFFGSVNFQDLPFELVKDEDNNMLANPKVWIPVSNRSVLDELGEKAKKLAQELLDHTISEERFKASVSRVYPELSYFGQSSLMQRDQTMCAMLSVFWLVSGQREAFIKCQEEDVQLSRQSWIWIQEWMTKVVKLSSEEVVDAALVFMAIHALGKITELREDLAPGFQPHEHDLALAQVLQAQASRVPSFLRLDQRYQRLLIDCLSIPFQFGQFLQGEDIPYSLVNLKDKLQAHGDFGFGYFCFGIFVRNCGKYGYRDLRGSLFMNEVQFERFRPGIDSIQQLRTLDPEQAYNAFLLSRGSKALSRFASLEHQAITRLLCLCSAYNYEAGVAPCEAFDALSPVERAELAQWLTKDGINQKPGYILADAKEYFKLAQGNESVGLVAALRKLLEALRLAKLQETQVLWLPAQVFVELHELASWAQDAGNITDFQRADLQVVAEHTADTTILTVKVFRPSNSLRPVASHRGGARWAVFMIAIGLLVIGLGALGAAASVVLVPKVAEPIMKSANVPQRTAVAGLTAVSCIALILSGCVCVVRVCGGPEGARQRRSLGYGSYERLRQADDDLV